MKTNKPRTDAVHVLICDQPVWLDTENLKDDSCQEIGANFKLDGGLSKLIPYKVDGECYFSHLIFNHIANKQGKREIYRHEYYFIKNLPYHWDDERKGAWYTFDRVEGGTVDVFFPASGYLDHEDGKVKQKNEGAAYWGVSFQRNPTREQLYYDFHNAAVNYFGFCSLPVRCINL
jgi:hypothetical protein